MGNDLIDYVWQDDHLLVLTWPPISAENASLIKNIAKYMVPGSSVRLHTKSGRIQVFLKK